MAESNAAVLTGGPMPGEPAAARSSSLAQPAPSDGATTAPRARWTLWHPIVAAILVAAGVALTWDGWRDLLWLAKKDEESSHIMLVPIVAVWLLWAWRDRLVGLRPGFGVIGLIFIGLGWWAWEASYYDNLRVGGHIAAVALAVGAILAVTGDRLFWRALPVFGVLLFAIPVPHSIRTPISMPLQRITAQITEHLLQVFGIAVTRAGSVLTINGHDVGVAEACNGMRMVFALFMVSYLFAFINDLRMSIRLLILVAAPVLALVCNVLRLVPTVYLYGYADHDVAELFHDLSGWVMIGVAFALMLGTLSLVRWLLVDDHLLTGRPASNA